MKQLILLLFINACLFSNTITFDELSSIALEKSYLLQDIEEDIRLDEIRLYSLTYPGLLTLTGSLSPTYYILEDDSEFDFGSVSLGISPYHNINLSTSISEDSTSFSLSYTPLKSKRDIIKARKDIEINRIRYDEIYRDTLKELKKKYNNLYYSRELVSLKRKELDFTKVEVKNLENRTNLGLGNKLELNRLYMDINSYENELFERELELLKAEKELSLATGLNLIDYELKPIKALDRDSQVILQTIDQLKGSSDFLALMDSIRDQELALKDAKLDIIPDITLTGGVTTSDFTDFTGSLTVQGSFNLDLGYRKDIEREEIILKKLKREKELKISEYENNYEFSLREVDLRIKRIKLLEMNLLDDIKRVEIAEFRKNRGEALELEVEKAMVQKSITELQLNHELVNFTVEYLEDRYSEQILQQESLQ